MYNKKNQVQHVFALLCSNPVYHFYLNNFTMWGRFKDLTVEDFFKDFPSTTEYVPNIPYNLSRSDHGLQFLRTIIMLRADIRKQLAKITELFNAVRLPQVSDSAVFTCLYKMLSLSEEGKEIINLLQQTNPELRRQAIDKIADERKLDSEGRENPIGDIIISAGNAKAIFRRNSDGNCFFSKMVYSESYREDLIRLANTRPDLFADVPFFDLFRTYDIPAHKIKNIPIILIMLNVYPDLRIAFHLVNFQEIIT